MAPDLCHVGAASDGDLLEMGQRELLARSRPLPAVSAFVLMCNELPKAVSPDVCFGGKADIGISPASGRSRPMARDTG